MGNKIFHAIQPCRTKLCFILVLAYFIKNSGRVSIGGLLQMQICFDSAKEGS